MNKVLLFAIVALGMGAELLACGCGVGRRTVARPGVTRVAGR